MKKHFLSLLALTAALAIALPVFALAMPDFTPENLGAEPVTINFWHCASDDAAPLMDRYVEEFNKNNPYQITVNASYQGQYSDATTLLKTVLSAENYGELPDIMQLDATGKVVYFGSGKAYTVDDALKEFPDEKKLDEYLPVALSNWNFSGVQLGMPFATSTTITYFNKTMLAEAGWDKAPATFDEVIKLAEDMQSKGMTQKVLRSIPNTPTLANWLGQMGSFLVDKNNGSSGSAEKLDCLDNNALADFLSAWKAMYDAGAIVNESSSTDAFIAGEVALLVSSSSNTASLSEKIGDKFELGASNYLRVSDKATDGATAAGSCVAMFDSGDALKREAAWYFVQYLTGAGVQADFAANTGYIPSNKNALQQKVYQDAKAERPEYETTFEQLVATPGEMRSVTVGPSKDFYFAIIQGVSDMLSNNQSVEETVDIMADELNGLLEEYNRNNK